MDDVRKQYERWAYPEPIFDLENYVTGSYFYHCPQRDANLYQTFDDDLKPLEVLIAGCGTNQAAVDAFRSPDIHFTAIDISSKSLDHEEFLKRKYELNNLDIIQLNIESVGKLGKKFDHVISTGVLHHLPNPLKGLTALSQVMKENACLSLMMYGKTLRVGLYMIQEAFATLGLKQTEADIEIAKSVLNQAVPKDHAVNRYINRAKDIATLPGFVDTFLHPQDVSYSVRELLDLIHRAGFGFDTWLIPWNYSHHAFFQGQGPLLDLMDALPPLESAHVTDLLHGGLGTHRLIVRRAAALEKRNAQKVDPATAKKLHFSLHPYVQTKYLPDGNSSLVSDGQELGSLSPNDYALLLDLLNTPWHSLGKKIDNRSPELVFGRLLKAGIVMPSYKTIEH